MQYQYVREKQNYEDYAAGRVLLSHGGITAFPVRLASEIFQRCAAYFPDKRRLRLYDPCCGGAYLLTILGFLHGERLAALYGADIDGQRVALAADNLHLLTATGLDARAQTLQTLVETYHKQSHQDALISLEKLRQKRPEKNIQTSVWVADAQRPTLAPHCIDMLICDVPYDDVTAWHGNTSENPIEALLDAAYPALVAGGVVAIISDKKQKATHPRYRRLQHQKIGKRRFILLQK